jgi:hypothetical protein
MKCAHCHVPNADRGWYLTACADKRKRRSKRLCNECDVELNRIVLEYFNDPLALEKIEAYKEALP